MLKAIIVAFPIMASRKRSGISLPKKMDFTQALQAALMGHCIRRNTWDGSDTAFLYIYYDPDCRHYPYDTLRDENLKKFIDRHPAFKKVIFHLKVNLDHLNITLAWFPKPYDIYALDWTIYRKNKKGF